MEVACRFPTFFGVAFGTLRAISTVVRIFMASGTIFSREFGELEVTFEALTTLSVSFLGRSMTLRTPNLGVLTLDLKIRQIMIEGLFPRKRIRSMTRRTGLRCKLRLKHPFMFIRVTIFAVAFVIIRKDKLLSLLRRLGC